MIRQFRSEDACFCCEIIRACLGEDDSLSSCLRAKLCEAETPESVEARPRLFYLAVFESKDGIEGIVGLDMNEIRLLCVRPGSRLRGIGRELVEHVRAMVPEFLFKDIFVYSSRKAVTFYRSLGFIEGGQISFSVCGEIFPTVFMRLPVLHPQAF